MWRRDTANYVGKKRSLGTQTCFAILEYFLPSWVGVDYLLSFFEYQMTPLRDFQYLTA